MIRIDNKITSELSEKDLIQIVDGFNQVFSQNRPIEVALNQYIQNPYGYSYHTIVYDDDVVVGHVCGVPSYYWKDEEKFTLVDGVDAYIKKDYRDGETFLAMLTTFFMFQKNQGVKMLIGFPDSEVMKLYMKTKIYKHIGDMYIYMLPYRIGGWKPALKYFNWLSEAFSWGYVWMTGLFASKKVAKYRIEKDAESFNATRYKRMDGDYRVVNTGDLEFFYKCMPFKGVRAAFLIDVTGKSAKHFNQAVKYMLKNNNKDFDVILYVGNLYFKNSGLIKVPNKFSPKHFHFIMKIFDKSYNNEMVLDIRNWDVNLATYDVI